MITKVQSQETEFGTRQKYLDIIRILLEETKIDSKLVSLCCSTDKLLCYMSAKSLASLVCFQLKEESMINVTWLGFCLKNLSEFSQSNPVAECLWILTTIIGEALREGGLRKADLLKKLFTPLDTVFQGFYNCILQHHYDLPQDSPAYSKATKTLIHFLDLLEALVATRIQLRSSFMCQRIIFLGASRILDLAGSSVHDLIKKKSIMLIKRCILFKAGEDFVKGSLATSSLEGP
uniref:Protein Lines N-terminal domain-containing protein n=1 Tax=Sphenodon punctatus TaxID=8508 RepID=A0A8D0H2M8_SPHPU